MPKSTRNKLAGKGKSKSSEKKKAYDKKLNNRPDQIAKRVELNRENRRRGTYGNGDKKDLAHQKDGSLKQQSQSKNRGKTGEGGRKKGRKKG